MKQNILFLCTGNSCRSQMAEGFCRAMHADKFEVYSAGIEKHGMNERAMQVMAESGTDISAHYSKTLDDLDQHYDIVITVCGHADESCPVFPGDTNVIHIGFDDPPKLAKDAASEEEALNHYRRVRDEIATTIASLPERITAH